MSWWQRPMMTNDPRWDQRPRDFGPRSFYPPTKQGMIEAVLDHCSSIKSVAFAHFDDPRNPRWWALVTHRWWNLLTLGLWGARDRAVARKLMEKYAPAAIMIRVSRLP